MQKKIIVVDDDPSILLCLQSLLESEGYHVNLFDNAIDILMHIETIHPKLIVLDIVLEDKDGRDIVKQLKAQKSTQDISVILISAHYEVEQSARAAGADAFISKPFDAETLLSTIKQYVD